MKERKPIFKRKWFWIVIIAAIGFAVANIIIACVYEDEHSNLFLLYQAGLADLLLLF